MQKLQVMHPCRVFIDAESRHEHVIFSNHKFCLSGEGIHLNLWDFGFEFHPNWSSEGSLLFIIYKQRDLADLPFKKKKNNNDDDNALFTFNRNFKSCQQLFCNNLDPNMQV